MPRDSWHFRNKLSSDPVVLADCPTSQLPNPRGSSRGQVVVGETCTERFHVCPARSIHRDTGVKRRARTFSGTLAPVPDQRRFAQREPRSLQPEQLADLPRWIDTTPRTLPTSNEHNASERRSLVRMAAARSKRTAAPRVVPSLPSVATSGLVAGRHVLSRLMIRRYARLLLRAGAVASTMPSAIRLLRWRVAIGFFSPTARATCSEVRTRPSVKSAAI